jgi:hypothetical protein
MIGKLILLAILALGVGIALPSTRPRIVDPVRNRIHNELVPRKLETIAAQLDQMTQRGEQLPAGNWAGWIEAYTTQSATDPWGNVYYLDRRRDGFVVGSFGPDGTKNTTDDITVSRSYPTRRR